MTTYTFIIRPTRDGRLESCKFDADSVMEAYEGLILVHSVHAVVYCSYTENGTEKGILL